MRTMLDRLDTRWPIWNAGMGGGLAGAELVAAVAEAGGLGVLGTGAMPPAAILALVEQTRRLTSAPIGANIIMPMSDGSDIEACFDAGIEVLVLFWGDPQPWVADAHKRGMFVVAQCGGGADAVAAADAGVDAVIIQGIEAGGHVKAVAPLADTLREARGVLGRLPIIAAGGIANGADIQQALTHGAQAVSLGTRFVASHEACAVSGYKERLVSAGAADTVMTDLYDIGWPAANHRVIRNQTYARWESAGKPAPGARPGEGDEIGRIGSGEEALSVPRYSVMPPITGFDGDLDAAPLYAGESVEQVKAIEASATIMARLTDELRRAAT